MCACMCACMRVYAGMHVYACIRARVVGRCVRVCLLVCVRVSCVQVASTWGYLREGYTAMNQRQVPYLGSLFDFPYDNVRTDSYVKEHRVRTNEYVKNKRTIICRWMETGGPGGEHVQRQNQE
jgi:hypothetical protein